jgi:hypothetical protein
MHQRLYSLSDYKVIPAMLSFGHVMPFRQGVFSNMERKKLRLNGSNILRRRFSVSSAQNSNLSKYKFRILRFLSRQTHLKSLMNS